MQRSRRTKGQARWWIYFFPRPLQDKGKINALQAKLRAEKEFEEYRVIQDESYISDFDKEMKRITGKKDAE